MSLGEKDVPVEVVGLGARLSGLRTGRGWTLEELSEQSSLSVSFLSRLEDGARQPSLAALITLARVYDVSLSSLFDTPNDNSVCVIVRAEECRERTSNGLSYSPLTNTSRPTNLQPMRVTVPLQRSGTEQYAHEGEEWLYVISGRLGLVMGNHQHDLKPGDAAHLDARAPHRLKAIGDTDTEILLITCVAPRPVFGGDVTFG